MIIVRAPLRISFVGGGTDIHDFYRNHPGRVISATINKYVYVSINPAPITKKVTARYSAFEMVDHARELRNDRMRAALLDLGLHSNIDIATFSDMAVGTGLGSSSSFSVALIKGLAALLGKKLGRQETAELACRLEIELLKEPIGKQDQYAAAIGGFNIFQFNQDQSVAISSVNIDYRIKLGLNNHLLLFFTGITREASIVLNEQRANTEKNFEVLKTMADSVYLFRDCLEAGDFQALGRLVHKGWQSKKGLASVISNRLIDELYEVGINNGAWGGKLLGAGAGGCLLFLAPVEKKAAIRSAILAKAREKQLNNFQEIAFSFVQSGAEILINDNFPNHNLSRDFLN